MDKGNETSTAVYSRDGQVLTVERCFFGTQTVQEVLKQYLLEQKPKFADRAGPAEEERT